MSKKWSQIPLELPVEPEVKPTVWVLTSEVDAHDQFGEYFEEVFANKPTVQQLIPRVPKDHVDALLNLGSSFEINTGYWWILRELTPK